MKFLEKTLGFDPKTMKLRTELIAGVTTFLTMSYILAVNPSILMSTGMSQGALFTATALASAIATLLLAFMAKLPFAQAPSMGLNAFFAYTLCQAMGYSWQNSLAILLIEGIVFILITFFNVREMIFNAIPNNLRYAISAGIGMFIAFIGLKNAEIIVSKEGTFVGLGAFTAPCLLGIFATLLSGVLMARNVKGALFWSIIAATLLGIPMGVTNIPSGWLPVSAPQDISPIFCQFDFSGLLTLKTGLVHRWHILAPFKKNERFRFQSVRIFFMSNSINSRVSGNSQNKPPLLECRSLPIRQFVLECYTWKGDFCGQTHQRNCC